MNSEDKEMLFEYSFTVEEGEVSKEQPFVPLEELMYRGRNNRNTYLESDVRVGSTSGERGYYNR